MESETENRIKMIKGNHLENLKADASPLLYIATVFTALTTFILPQSVLQSAPVELLFNFQASLIPKLSSDSSAIADSLGDVWAARYLLVYFLSIVWFIPILLFCLRFAEDGFRRPRKKALELDEIRFVARVLVLLILLYFIFVDRMLTGSDARLAKGIFRTPIFVIWIPMTFTLLTQTVQMLSFHIARGLTREKI